MSILEKTTKFNKKEYKYRIDYGGTSFEKIVFIEDVLNGIGLKIDVNSKIAFFVDNSNKIISKFQITYTKENFKPKNKKNLKKSLSTLEEKIKEIDKKEADKIKEIFCDEFWVDLGEFMVAKYGKFFRERTLIQALNEKPKSPALLMRFSKKAEKELNICKVVDTADNSTFYYLNGTSYEILTINKFRQLINERYNLRLPESSLKEVLMSIPNISMSKDYLWEFNNGYLNTRTYKFEQTETIEITPKKAGITTESGFKKVDYDDTVKLLSDNPTFVEKTLREIFIPKYNPEDTSLYIDFLQRLGACRIPNNKHKKITIYLGDGNDGKSTALYLMRLTFGEHFIGTTGDSMKRDMFNAHYIGNKHIISIDEITTNSFYGIWDFLKRISSGIANTSSRGAYDKNPTRNIKYGSLYICSNVSPNLDYVDNATLSRVDILQMPNRFVGSPQNENEYLIDNDIIWKLLEDNEGLQWLINASIKSYMDMESNFLCSQTAEETKLIFSEGDDMTRFLTRYTRLSKDNRTLASDLVNAFISYANDENINYTERYGRSKNIPLAISKEIGVKLKQIYDPRDLDKGETIDRKKDYAIELIAYN